MLKAASCWARAAVLIGLIGRPVASSRRPPLTVSTTSPLLAMALLELKPLGSTSSRSPLAWLRAIVPPPASCTARPPLVALPPVAIRSGSLALPRLPPPRLISSRLAATKAAVPLGAVPLGWRLRSTAPLELSSRVPPAARAAVPLAGFRPALSCRVGAPLLPSTTLRLRSSPARAAIARLAPAVEAPRPRLRSSAALNCNWAPSPNSNSGALTSPALELTLRAVAPSIPPEARITLPTESTVTPPAPSPGNRKPTLIGQSAFIA